MSLSVHRAKAAIGNPKAFTLVEVLVSLGVLSLIVLMVAQILTGSTNAITQNNKTLDALNGGEVVFQQIGLDISRMLLRDDIDYNFIKNPGGNDVLSFYARTSGLSSTGSPVQGTPRPLSVVGYKVKTNSQNALEFDYGALQVDWTNPVTASGSIPFATSAILGATATQPGIQTQLFTRPNSLPDPDTSPDVIPYTTLAPEVIRFEYCFVLKSGSNATPSQYLYAPTSASVLPNTASNPNSTPPALNPLGSLENVAAIVVGIVVVDPKSRLILPSGTDAKVSALFPDAASNQDLLSLWTPIVNDSQKLQQAGVPLQAVAGIHVYQKYFPLPW